MYVDGLLAENHGVLPLEFDPLLAESTGSEDMPYLDQPWWNTPDPLPDGGTHLVYLDVWHREVTHVEAPDLIEPAIGVDTTARSQTVWQVRLHPVPAGGPSVTCSTPDDEIPGWAAVIAPSAGRLTVGTIEVDEDDDPCDLPPTGGYRGRENQTYRIQVHDGGTVEEATFKWSRENASIVQPVVEMISPTTLRLASVGRDDVLRISTGDWVEIIDDNAELDQQPGVMRNVVVDDATSTITFADPLPADLQPADADDADARHLRVKRWDQSGEVVSATGVTLADLDDPNSTGLIDVPDSPRHAGRPRTRDRRLVRRGGDRRTLPHRGPLDRRRPHGQHLGRRAGRRASLWHPPSLRPTRGRRRSPTPRRAAVGCGHRCPPATASRATAPCASTRSRTRRDR